MEATPVAPATISVDAASRRIGIGRWALYRLIQSGKFYPAVHLGARIRVNVVLLEQWLVTGGQRDVMRPRGHLVDDIERR